MTKSRLLEFIVVVIIIVGITYYYVPTHIACVPYEMDVREDEDRTYDLADLKEFKDLVAEKPSLLYMVGDSMLPTIEGNSMCYCVSKENYYVGDIVVYFTPEGRLISHRIIESYNGEFITQGDNNPIPDPYLIEQDWVVCKVAYVPYSTIVEIESVLKEDI